MIYSKNRIASIGEVTIDVNESYLGAGSLFFEQECIEDELALFEAAIKSDIEEHHITEASGDVKKMAKDFAEKAKKTIENILTKFMEMLKALYQGGIAKFNEWLVKDNAKFCANAKKHIKSLDASKFVYKGKALKVEKKAELSKQINNLEVAVDSLLNLWKNTQSSSSVDSEGIKEKVSALTGSVKGDIAKFNSEFVYTEENGDLKLVEGHIDILEKFARKECMDLKKKCMKFEAEARKMIKDSKKLGKSEDEAEKAKANAMCEIARAIKQAGAEAIRYGLQALRHTCKIARAVVTKAVGTVAANEGTELVYDEELVNAMIETTNYELDELLEEMSEGVECDFEEISEETEIEEAEIEDIPEEKEE